MAIYIDTSALIKRYVSEPSSARVERFLAGERDELVLSPLGPTEFESTLQRRFRSATSTAPSSSGRATCWRATPRARSGPSSRSTRT